MVALIETLYDPEFLFPDDDYIGSTEFWLRLFEIDELCEAKIDSGSYLEFCSLCDLLQERFDSHDFPMPDFWSLINRMAGRIYDLSFSEEICEENQLAEYLPLMGSKDNAARLNRILHADTGEDYISLLTLSELWSTKDLVLKCTADCQSGSTIYLSWAFEFTQDKHVSNTCRAIIRSDPGLLSVHYLEAFPNLVFAKNIFNSISSIPGEKRVVEGLVGHHLEVLDDFALRIWSEFSDTKDRESSLLKFNVVASRESPKKHKDKKAMKERTVRVLERDFVCEWHTKLFPNVGRIYFNVDEKLGLVVVGKINRHLR